MGLFGFVFDKKVKNAAIRIEDWNVARRSYYFRENKGYCTMKKLIAIVTLTVATLLPSFQLDAKTYVKGYYRKNGTYVAPHYRNSPGESSYYSGGTSPRSGYSTITVPRSSGIIKVPKSYEVYQQRKEQGPRTFSKSMKQRKYQEQGGVCPHCNKQCPYGEMEGDHITPYSKGGETSYQNLQMLCRPCNRSKGNRYSY